MFTYKQHARVAGRRGWKRLQGSPAGARYCNAACDEASARTLVPVGGAASAAGEGASQRVPTTQLWQNEPLTSHLLPVVLNGGE